MQAVLNQRRSQILHEHQAVGQHRSYFRIAALGTLLQPTRTLTLPLMMILNYTAYQPIIKPSLQPNLSRQQPTYHRRRTNTPVTPLRHDPEQRQCGIEVTVITD